MKTQSRFIKATALLGAALTTGLLLSTAQPAMAGASTGTWKYYPNGLYGAPAYGNGYYGNPGYYGNRGGYGYRGRPVYGSPYAQPYYGNGGYYGNGYYEPYYQRRRSDNGAAVAAGVFGLAAGAILGSALSQQNRSSGVSCTQYRSYNPRTGTFIGKNGVRYACR